MKMSEHMNKRLEEMMGSLDGIQKADPGPWFFTRLNNRLLNQRKSLWAQAGSFLSRPAVAFGGILSILLLNVALVISERNDVPVPAAASHTVITDNEYITASNSSFDYENLVQP